MADCFGASLGRQRWRVRGWDREATIQEAYLMRDRELYQEKLRAQLDEWKAELEKLKAKAAGARADVQLKMKPEIEKAERRLEEGRKKLSKLAEASDEAWESARERLESVWGSLKSAFDEATRRSRE